MTTEFEANQKKIEEIMQVALKQTIGKDDIEATRVVIAALLVGNHKRKAKRLANVKSFNECWRNLEKSGYFVDDKVRVGSDFDDNDIPFILMVLTAKGFVETKWNQSS